MTEPEELQDLLTEQTLTTRATRLKIDAVEFHADTLAHFQKKLLRRVEALEQKSVGENPGP